MATNSNNTTDNDESPEASASAPNTQSAADLIRQKLDSIYGEEPDAAQEIVEAENLSRRTQHQQFVYDLSTSGKDLATIQTEWHNYYQSLPDHEKHQVWQEFYSSQPSAGASPPANPNPQSLAKHMAQAASGSRGALAQAEKRQKIRDVRSSDDVKAAIRDKVTAGGKLQAKHHLQSLLFGLGMGAIVLIIFLFGFFNEIVIAPFIQPSRAQADTPLIIGNSSLAPTTTPEVIIPKINVEIPVNYSETSTNENNIENDLEGGVVHYPTTSLPGQDGNAAFFGHSSNNIFNKGKYKFAFVLLHTLVKGDTFYLTYNDKVYIYKVISTAIVDPSDVAVLNPVVGQTATATLITCDPPGTSLHRLIVVGQQISPDPASNASAATNSTATPAAGNSSSLPGNGPTLWSKFVGNIVGKIIVFGVIIAIAVFAFRNFWRPLLGRA
jgi:LPXTG-site transpeptidase (sortase) family protein